jgi:hypothetical protein
MLLALWFRRLTPGSPTASRRRGSRPALSRRSVLPRLEVLEDRSLPSTFTVMNLNNDGPNSLRAAIASGDNTIDFAHGLHGAITLASALPQITSSVTINGPGANQLSVSGNNLYRVFDISDSASVNISGLTLQDGLATAGGGILLEGSAALRLSDCTLEDNEAVGGVAGAGLGGGIEDTSSGALTVSNCTFDANKAIATGPNTIPNSPGYAPGYVLALGGGIDLSFVASGSATISDSTFVGNQALGGTPGASAGGGALSNSSNTPGTTMTVTGCTLSGNAAIGAAGGDGLINFGSGQGGGINDFDNLTVRDSTLTGNLAQGTPLAPGAAPSQTSNSGSTTAGGGVFCLGVYVPDAAVSVADSTLAGNQAIGGAGAAGSAGSIGEGGGISLIAVPPALVADCVVAANVAQGGAGGTGGVGATGVSGGIDLSFGSVVTVSNTLLIDNQAIGGAGGDGAKGGDGVGGGVNVGSGVITGFPDNCSLALTDSILLGNQAIGGAGGSGSKGGNGTGGGLSVLAGSSAAVSTSIIVANQAQGGAAGAGGTKGSGVGGGVYNLGTFTFDAFAVINGNHASTSNDDIFG